MDLRQLRYFLAIAEAGSFTAAARRLHVSQPALGYQVKQLEERHGLALLERHSRGVALTPAGAILADHARRIFAEVEAAEGALAPDLVAASASGAEARLALREGLSDELARAVAAGELDAALCYDPLGTERLEAIPLYTEDLYLVGSPGVVGGSGDIEFAEVSRLPLVVDGRFQAGRRLIEAAAREKGLRLDMIEAEAVTVKRELLVRHGRCSIVPLGLFFEEIRAGQLVARRVVSPTIGRTLVLLLRRGLDPLRARALEQALRPLVAERIASGELAWRAPGA